MYDNTKCSGPYVAYAGYTTGKCFMHDGYYSAYDCSTGDYCGVYVSFQC